MSKLNRKIIYLNLLTKVIVLTILQKSMMKSFSNNNINFSSLLNNLLICPTFFLLDNLKNFMHYNFQNLEICRM